MNKAVVNELKTYIDDYSLDVRVIRCGNIVTVDRTKERAALIASCFVMGMILGEAVSGSIIPGVTYGVGAGIGMVIGLIIGFIIRKRALTWT